MSNFYFCYLRNLSSSIPVLIDESGSSTCVLCSSDFDKLFDKFYIITICGTYFPLDSSDRRKHLRISHRVTNYILKFGKLPNICRI